jgi:hypothetical protein
MPVALGPRATQRAKAYTQHDARSNVYAQPATRTRARQENVKKYAQGPSIVVVEKIAGARLLLLSPSRAILEVYSRQIQLEERCRALAPGPGPPLLQPLDGSSSRRRG